MKRTALVTAALFVAAASLMYLFGNTAVLIFALVLCITAALYSVFCIKRTRPLLPVTILIIAALFCSYLAVYSNIHRGRAESYIGETQEIVCRVTDEPEYALSYTRLSVKTDDNTDNLRLLLFVDRESDAANARPGDLIKATVTFSELKPSLRASSYSHGIFVSAKLSDSEIIGHKESFNTKLISLRQSIGQRIYLNTDGDGTALLQGFLLGGTDSMSDELYSSFKICGLSHVTAVSGMHIGTFCTAVFALLCFFMHRRVAAAFTFIPLVFTVLLAGMTPSAVRSGIMCGIMLLSCILLKKTDSLNSLGVAVTVMVAVNPYYILDLGFQLSCGASAGVILSTPYADTLAAKLIRFDLKFVSKALKTAVVTFVQSVGAVIFTLPFQVYSLGYISLISPLSSILVCAVAMYAMIFTAVGVALSFIPILSYVATIPFFIAQLLADYISFCVDKLSEIPFSYIAFGSDVVLLWVALSIAVAALWYLFGKIGGLKIVSLAISLLLALLLTVDTLASKGIVSVCVLDVGGGLCVSVEADGRCVLIGTGDDSYDRYTISSHLKQSGIDMVEMLLLPNASDGCFGGYKSTVKAVSPSKTVVADSFKADIKSDTLLSAADGETLSALGGKLKITPLLSGDNCAFLLEASEKTVFVSYGKFALSADKTVDVSVSGAVLPSGIVAKQTVTSVGTEANGNHISADGNNIILKLKSGKGIKIYEEQK